MMVLGKRLFAILQWRRTNLDSRFRGSIWLGKENIPFVTQCPNGWKCYGLANPHPHPLEGVKSLWEVMSIQVNWIQSYVTTGSNYNIALVW